MPPVEDIRKVLASDLFDLEWYLARAPDAPAKPEKAAAYFLNQDASSGIDPGPHFSMARYLQANPDVAAAGMNPLLHYLVYGRAEGRVRFPAGDVGCGVLNGGRERALLHGSSLFDPDFYLDRYPDVRNAGVDPLHHFISHGAKEGRWPNPWFDTNWYRANNQSDGDNTNPLVHYLRAPDRVASWTSEWFDGRYYYSRHPDVVAAGLTPLEHFLQHSVDNTVETKERSFAAPLGRLPDPASIRTTVVVTVHNAANHLLACLDGLQRHTRFGLGDRLLVIDDASDDPAVREILQQLKKFEWVKVIHNERNIGYTASANLGCRLAAGDDVVLLNSDTIVGPHWLRNLKIAAYRRTRVGTVTAVSDNAGAFSVFWDGANQWLPGVSTDAMARAVADANAGDFEVPTGNGFCLYIRRTMLNEVGDFNEQAFPLGYGEENDLCMRALNAGWHHVVSPRVFVRHARSASFGERREELARAGAEQLRALHPSYPAATAGLIELRGFVLARYRIRRKLRALKNGEGTRGPRLLYVLSTNNGGVPQSNADLMRALASDFDCLVLRCDSRVVELWVLDGNDYRTLESHSLAEPIGFGTHVSEEYESVLRDILYRYSIDLLHIRHIAWHSLNITRVTHGMGIPVFHSIHDFYSICPSVNLVDRRGHLHSQGVVENGENALWSSDPAAAVPMSRSRLEEWQLRMETVIREADALFVTSRSACDVLLSALPRVAARGGPEIHVIPHGRDFAKFESLSPTGPVDEGQPLRVLLPGNIALHKGAGLVAEIARMAPPGTLEFHLLGTASPLLDGLVVDHGPYDREQFARRVAEIRPHVAAILSLAPETWCHTLTECWAAGLPVLALDRGAVGERIREHGGGWLIPAECGAVGVLEQLVALRSPSSERARVIEAILVWQRGPGGLGTTRRMANAYRAQYDAWLPRGHGLRWVSET